MLGIEVRGERVDQLLGHLDLALVELAAVLGDDVLAELVGSYDLVGEAHRGHRQDVVGRADRGEVLAVSQHEARDGDLLRVAHRLHEQRVGLLGALVGAEVVRVVEVDGVDVVEVDEVLDLDRPRLLRVDLLELVARDRPRTARAPPRSP